MKRRGEATITENTPPLSIRTPDGAVIPTKYRNEHLAFMELLNISEREHKEKRSISDSRVWLLTDADDPDAILAEARIDPDGVLRISKR